MTEILGAHFVWVIGGLCFIAGFGLGRRCSKAPPTAVDVPSLDLVKICRRNLVV